MSKRFVFEISEEEDGWLEEARIRRGLKSRSATIHALIVEEVDRSGKASPGAGGASPVVYPSLSEIRFGPGPSEPVVEPVIASPEGQRASTATASRPPSLMATVQLGRSTSSPGSRLKQPKGRK